ncbi:FUSC family protein [Agrobacterium vitis]|uniref:FUSC family protein n=1 Tax=Agrobacterium vitis TaxID=373 RepID=UPI0015DB3644|nr:FUSC family protein [Agrobacterium vitis]
MSPATKNTTRGDVNWWRRRFVFLKGPSVSFALRTTIAAILAMALATLLQIHHPYWAAMTVWLVAQPTRGLVVERGLARLVGTIIGALVGFLMLWQLSAAPGLQLSVLICWVALCAAAGSFFRHFRSYGLLLAGYTAAVVTMSGLIEPQLGHELAWSRIACTLIGVVASLVATVLFAPGATKDMVHTRSLALLRQALSLSATLLKTREETVGEPVQQFFSAVVQMDADLDTLAAGSLTGHQRARFARHIAAASTILVTEAMTARQLEEPQVRAEKTADTLAVVDQALGRGDIEAAHAAVTAIGDHAPQLSAAVTAAINYLGELSVVQPVNRLLDLNALRISDKRAAAIAFCRTFLALSAVALVWKLTGWSLGPVMLMTAAVFVTLFSSHEAPQLAVGEALKGTLCGATLGMFSRIFLLPHAENSLDMLLMVAPFLAVGAYAMSRPKTAKAAIDGNMSFLLAAQPVFPVAVSPWLAVEQTLAMVAGVAAAALAFRFVFPVNHRLVLTVLRNRLTEDLEVTARLASHEQVLQRRFRMIQRILRMGSLRLVAPSETSRDVFLLLCLVTMLGRLLERRGRDDIASLDRRYVDFALEALKAAPENWEHHHSVFSTLLKRDPVLVPHASL